MKLPYIDLFTRPTEKYNDDNGHYRVAILFIIPSYSLQFIITYAIQNDGCGGLRATKIHW